jgi:hypothetical protein
MARQPTGVLLGISRTFFSSSNDLRGKKTLKERNSFHRVPVIVIVTKEFDYWHIDKNFKHLWSSVFNLFCQCLSNFCFCTKLQDNPPNTCTYTLSDNKVRKLDTVCFPW